MKSVRRFILYIFLLLCCGCASVVYTTNAPSYAVAPKVTIEKFDPLTTAIGRVYSTELTADSQLSGAMLISSGQYALFHRISLARMAEHSIDLQTYIYENDITSRLLLHEMKLAADRGVKILILVDDFGLDSDHSDITILNNHPNIEVKVFNAFKYRSRLLRYPQFAVDMGRLNHRMHNKLFIVDNAAMIIGGRNVASNYFDNNPSVNFSDTDVMFIGQLARDATRSFNRYWNFHKSISVSVFQPDNTEKLERFDSAILNDLKPENLQGHIQTVDAFINAYYNKEYPVYWGRGELIVDSPLKTEGYEPVSPITERLETLLSSSNTSIYLSAAYFVPGKSGNRQLTDAADRGVGVKVLTNSLSSTDAKVVYAGWMRYRKELLRHGVQVHEFRNEGYKVKNRGGSGASLHSKVILFDENITWVGSFNLDPRSASINTEVVAIFYSEEFGKVVRQDIEEDMSEDRSWRLMLEEDRIYWQTRKKGEIIRTGSSPDTPVGISLLILLLSFVPEDQI